MEKEVNIWDLKGQYLYGGIIDEATYLGRLFIFGGDFKKAVEIWKGEGSFSRNCGLVRVSVQETS